MVSFLHPSSITASALVCATFRKVKPAKTKSITFLSISFDNLMQHLELHAEETYCRSSGVKLSIQTNGNPSRLIAELIAPKIDEEYVSRRESLQRELELLGYTIVDGFSMKQLDLTLL